MKKFLILIGLLAAFSVTAYVSICNTEAKVRTLQSQRVCFTIVDEFGDPIPCVSVTVIAPNGNVVYGDTTDWDGEVCVNVPLNSTIKIEMIGYRTIEFVYNGQRPGTVTLRADY